MLEHEFATDVQSPGGLRSSRWPGGAGSERSFEGNVSISDLTNAIKCHERDDIEFKRTPDLIHTDPESTERLVTALANSALNRPALLIFGVDDTGEVMGLVDRWAEETLTSKAIKVRRQQFSQIVSRICPKVDYRWNELEFEGHRIVAIKIRGRVPPEAYRTSTGKYPYRLDSFTYYADADVVSAWRNTPSHSPAHGLESAVAEWKRLARQLHSAHSLSPAPRIAFKPVRKALPELGYESSKGGAGSLVDSPRALMRNRRLIILGPSGTGKSFLLRWLAHDTLRSNQHIGALGLPFYVRLNRFHDSLIDLLVHSCSRGIAPLLSETSWEELLKRYTCCLLLDGLSECDKAHAVISDLEEIWQLNDRIRVVMTARSLDGLGVPHLEKDLGFKISKIQPLKASQLRWFVQQFGGLGADRPKADSIVAELLTKLEPCSSWEEVPLGLGYAGHPLTISLMVIDRLQGDRTPTLEAVGQLYKRTWIDGTLTVLRSNAARTRPARAWLRLKLEALGAIATTMCARPRPTSILTEAEVVAAIDSTLTPGRRNYKDIRDEILEELVLLGILIPAANEISFCHDTLRDFFWAHKIASSGRKGWNELLLNHEAPTTVAFLSGLLENPYQLLDYVYKEAGFNTYLAAHLAAALEHGMNLHDLDRNLAYLQMIFWYREGERYLGPRSLSHVRSFISAVGGPTRNLSATQRYLDLLENDRRTKNAVLEEIFASSWSGRWTLLAHLPALGIRRMVDLARELFFSAPQGSGRLRILTVISAYEKKLVLHFLEDLSRHYLEADERRLVDSVLTKWRNSTTKSPT